jgi:hypothetical protein
MPVPGDPYIRSAGFPRVGQPLVQQAQVENPEWQQLHMLGYARRADELNRLLALSQMPAAIAGDLPGSTLDPADGGSAIDAKQEGSTVDGAAPAAMVATAQPAPNSDERSPDVAITGSVNGQAAATPSNTATGAGAVEPKPADPNPTVASTQTGSSETEDVQSTTAPIALPPAKPKVVHTRRRVRVGRAATSAPPTASSPDANSAPLNDADRTVAASNRALGAAKPATTPAAATRGGGY